MNAQAERLTLLDRWPDAPSPVLDEAPVLTNMHVADRCWRLRLLTPRIAATARPGQFVMLTVADRIETAPVLPRPMAIYSADPGAGTIDVLYGVVGHGTQKLTQRPQGTRITVVGPLGRGFEILTGTGSLLLIGRGIGTCSLTMVAAAAVRRGLQVTTLDSARNPAALIGDAEYKRVGVQTRLQVVDSDGTSQVSAVRHILRRAYGSARPDQVFVCGSQRLTDVAEDLATSWGADLQVSLEAHMACGLGYCHGCASGQRTPTEETPLICRDGPVFRLARDRA